MAELQVQHLLRNRHDALEQLPASVIDWHWEEIEGHSYLHLDYGIGAKPTDDLVKECRGLALRASDYSIARMAFHRFMNFHEAGRDDFRWGEPILYQEKCDGSLIILSWFDELGHWVAGTRGCIFPDQKIENQDMTFPELFWSILPDRSRLDPSNCYIFELCSLRNRVVIRYDQPRLVLLAVRNVSDWSEYEPEILDFMARDLNVSRPQTFQFDCIEDCIEMAKTLPGTQEGFVIQQWNDTLGRYARAKIKGDQYKNLHNVISARSLGNLVRLVIGNGKGCIQDFPDFIKAYEAVESALDAYGRDIQASFERHRGILGGVDRDAKAARKAFAGAVAADGHASACFLLADGKFDCARSWLESQGDRAAVKRLIQRLDLARIVGAGWRVPENIDSDI
jgi:hypothetical protein